MNGATVKAYSLKEDGDKKLSENFRVREFACKGFDAVFVSEGLVQILQQIRSHFGQKVIIHSGYRPESYNKTVEGASSNSQHTYGVAADFHVENVAHKTVAEYAENFLKDTGGIGVYPWGVHVDVRKKKSRWKG